MQIPYQTNKSALVEKIAELVEDKVLIYAVTCEWISNIG